MNTSLRVSVLLLTNWHKKRMGLYPWARGFHKGQVLLHMDEGTLSKGPWSALTYAGCLLTWACLLCHVVRGLLSHGLGHSHTLVLVFLLTRMRVLPHTGQNVSSHSSDAPSRRYEWGPYLMLSHSPMGVETHHMNPSITSHRSWIFPIGMRVFPQISGCIFKEDMVLPHRGLGVPLIWVKSTVVRTILAISKASSSHSLLLS